MRADDTSPAAHPTAAIVLYDGVCKFCNRTVRFIIARDPHARFKFAALQSEIGQALLGDAGLDTESLDSIVLVDDGRCYVKSSAMLRITRRLRGCWPLTAVFRLVPAVVRDFFYDQFARRRYRWFGREDECVVPNQAIRERFLDHAGNSSGP